MKREGFTVDSSRGRRIFAAATSSAGGAFKPTRLSGYAPLPYSQEQGRVFNGEIEVREGWRVECIGAAHRTS